ncbi:ABC-type transporter, integral membrane subunit [Thalassoporum mexicanum PCC 7367]|uniref:energy-coupling factor transporter transmembrane component T family protein n=1 Tax=Thalassoporum mexicanum TaxID=3457544 RepID=UPI00029FAE8C|nr:CbiQ family ECF transporter T component [Pseudanabaena sp. PCC 7367]AFY71466.1 ABC-type transporter, integral membrane subunit [Pseudanabaena sp. PCC 7367]
MDLLRSLPLGLYLEQPVTWLHRLDPRVKLFWLGSFLLTPILANSYWRVGTAAMLFFITILARIPARAWRQQMGFLLLLSFMTLTIATLSPDGLNVAIQPRRPTTAQIIEFANKDRIANPDNPDNADNQAESPEPTAIELAQPTNYKYILFKAGSINITRRSFDLGVRISTLIFTYIYSPVIFLLVTAPEEITAGLTSIAMPLKRLRIPVVEITLTLTLALRFFPLVLEEMQNLYRAIHTRAINWKKLGIRRSIDVWLILVERLINNLFIRADQTASSMKVRGFTTPNTHRVRWNFLKLKARDYWLIGLLAVFWGLRFWIGNEF